MDDQESVWQGKGATLSEKTACKEYGLTREAILRAIRAGKLQYRQCSIYGNPFLRLLRREVETLVMSRHGAAFLMEKQVKTERARIDLELKRLKKQITALEARKSRLSANCTPLAPPLRKVRP